MPFVAYVRESEPDDSEDEGRTPWEPNWRLWRWVGAAIVVAYGASRADGLLEAVLVLVVFGLSCRAGLELLPNGGMHEWRQ
jgi:hypothetical protein